MKINFTAIQCKPSRKGNEVTINFAEQLGELVYQLAQTRKDKKLADLIGDSTGEIELNEEEVKTLVDNIKKSQFLYWAKEALLGVLGSEME